MCCFLQPPSGLLGKASENRLTFRGGAVVLRNTREDALESMQTAADDLGNKVVFSEVHLTMHGLQKVIHVIDTISLWSGKTVSWLVVVLTAVVGCEIFMRYIMNSPTRWSFDVSYMIGGSFFMLGEAYTLMRRGHVRIDIFYARFSEKRRAVIESVLYLLFFFPLWGGLLYVLIPYVWLSWKIGERSMQGYWMPVLYPFKTMMPVAILLFLLQGVAEFLRNVLTLCGRGES